MIKFSEYVKSRDQEITEGWGNAINGAISGVGRVPIQFARGLGNVAYGAGQTGLGAAQTAVGLGKGYLGGGWDTAGQGLKNMAMGPVNAASGIAQAATSPLSGLGRAYYAGRQPDNDGIGMAPNYQNPGAWGSFKNWMGWQGKPTVDDSLNSKPAPAQSKPIPQRPGPQVVQGQMPPQMPYQPGQSRLNPQAPPRPQPQMTPQQQAFFQKNPGFNQSGIAPAPSALFANW